MSTKIRLKLEESSAGEVLFFDTGREKRAAGGPSEEGGEDDMAQT